MRDLILEKATKFNDIGTRLGVFTQRINLILPNGNVSGWNQFLIAGKTVNATAGIMNGKVENFVNDLPGDSLDLDEALRLIPREIAQFLKYELEDFAIFPQMTPTGVHFYAFLNAQSLSEQGFFFLQFVEKNNN